MSEMVRHGSERGWTCGLVNMLKKENGVWLNRGKWIIQSILWSIVISGSIAFVLYLFTTLPAAVKPDIINSYGMGAAALQLFFNISGFVSVVGVIIITHDVIISERESGTADWVLSKPLSRKAFVISKLAVSTTWITLMAVLLQGGLLLIIARLFGGAVDIIPFVKGLAIVWLVCFFYITMTLLLGTMTTSRAVVLGISFFFFLLGGIVPLLFPESYYLTPWKLSDIAFSVSLSIAWSSKIVAPVIMTVIWSFIFTAGALWKIERIEI